MTYRKIIHIDLDAFYCAVEELSDPTLRNKPFLVGGRPDQRGVVSSCSYAARKFGIRSAMPTARAVQLCPDLIIIRGNHRSYSQYSQQVMTLLHSFTTQVEQISIDEAFLDVSEIPDPSENIARMIQEKINSELKLPCSLGVSTNKLVAKIATDVGKAANQSIGFPNAIQIVPPGKEAEFLAPLPVEMLWGVGPKTAIQLAELNIFLIGDITSFPETYLLEKFGKFGRALYYRSHGIDNREIITSHIAKSISCETTFSQDISNENTLLSQLKNLSKRVSKRLQKQRL
jgi:DNA polymerase-4